MTPDLSIVLAVQGGAQHLRKVLAALAPQCDASVEVLVCYAAEEQGIPETCADFPFARALIGQRRALIPHLWRDGILSARAPRVALSVVHCQPTATWVAELRGADLEHHAAIGGGLENDPDSDALGWAIFMLRYLRYLPPFAARETQDLAGDNVVYDRAALLDYSAAFADGFWEPEIHRRLAAAGRKLRLDPKLLTRHANGYSALGFAQQRLRHGKRFGFDRAQHMSKARRLLQLLAAPAVPVVFGGKIARAAWTHPEARTHFLPALPYLILFLNAWALGEVGGTLQAVVARTGADA